MVDYRPDPRSTTKPIEDSVIRGHDRPTSGRRHQNGKLAPFALRAEGA